MIFRIFLLAFAVICSSCNASHHQPLIRQETALTSSATDALPHPSRQDWQKYALNLKRCGIIFSGPRDRRVKIIGPEANSGFFSMLNYSTPRDEHFSIEFECHPVRASMFCPDYLSRNAKETDPVMIRDTQQKHLTRLHPIYWAEGYLNTGTAMSVPRTRELNFCLGDDKHSLTGRSVVGLEPREPWDTHGTPPDPQSEIALPAVLDLIRSIRFEEPVVDD